MVMAVIDEERVRTLDGPHPYGPFADVVQSAIELLNTMWRASQRIASSVGLC